MFDLVRIHEIGDGVVELDYIANNVKATTVAKLFAWEDMSLVILSDKGGEGYTHNQFAHLVNELFKANLSMKPPKQISWMEYWPQDKALLKRKTLLLVTMDFDVNLNKFINPVWRDITGLVEIGAKFISLS